MNSLEVHSLQEDVSLQKNVSYVRYMYKHLFDTLNDTATPTYITKYLLIFHSIEAKLKFLLQ